MQNTVVGVVEEGDAEKRDIAKEKYGKKKVQKGSQLKEVGSHVRLRLHVRLHGLDNCGVLLKLLACY